MNIKRNLSNLFLEKKKKMFYNIWFNYSFALKTSESLWKFILVKLFYVIK